MQKGIDFYAAMTPEELAEYLEPKRGEKEGKNFVILNPHPRFYEQMKPQWERQAQEVRDLIELLDGPDDAEDVQIKIVVTPGEGVTEPWPPRRLARC